MKTKICTKCKIKKPLEEFHDYKTGKYGKNSQCIQCIAKRDKLYRKNNKKLIAKRKKEYESRPEIKERDKKRQKDYYSRPEVKEKKIAYQKEYLLNPENKKRQKERGREWYLQPKNKAYSKAYNKAYREKPEIKAYRNTPEYKERVRAYEKNRRETDEQFSLIKNIRVRTKHAETRQGTSKSCGTYELLGMSGEELHAYLVSLGKITGKHVTDHIVPISRFNLKIKEHELIACYYKNLQPLTPLENAIKSDTLPHDWIERVVSMCNDRGIDPEPIIQHIQQQ